jgi:hypothetical protein
LFFFLIIICRLRLLLLLLLLLLLYAQCQTTSLFLTGEFVGPLHCFFPSRIDRFFLLRF